MNKREHARHTASQRHFVESCLYKDDTCSPFLVTKHLEKCECSKQTLCGNIYSIYSNHPKILRATLAVVSYQHISGTGVLVRTHRSTQYQVCDGAGVSGAARGRETWVSTGIL